MNLIKKYNLILTTTCLLSGLLLFSQHSQAANLTLNLDNESPSSSATLYRNNFFYSHQDYYDINNGIYPADQSDLQKFPGWKINLNWADLDNVAPDTYLTIDLASNNSANGMTCEFEVGNSIQNLFSLAADGRTIILNPNLPINYLPPPAQTPTQPLTCKASISAQSVDGTIHSSNSIDLEIHYYPQPIPIIPEENKRYIQINNQGYPLSIAPPNFILSHDAPLIISTMLPADQYSSVDYISYGGGDSNKVTIAGSVVSDPDNTHCQYYPMYSTSALPNKAPSDSLDVNIDSYTHAENPLIITAQWTETCGPAPGEDMNEHHSISSSVRTKNRFQYGTFTVNMKPNLTSGTNSAFFTYFAPNNIPESDTSHYNFGYFWHEMDVELLPGTPIHNNTPTDQEPWYQAYGFHRPVTEANTANSSVSWNIISPGNIALNPDGFGAINHERYCMNENDASNLSDQSTFPGQCHVNSRDINPFDGNYHDFQIKWTTDEVSFYIDNTLSTTYKLKDLNKATGIDTKVNPSSLWNEGFVIDANGKKHLTSPAAISMNFWVVTPQNWGGEFSGLTKDDKIETNYRYVQWNPEVDGVNMGKVYDSEGNLLPQEQQQSYQWDFSQITDLDSFLQDWQFDPANGFDSNNSYFIQNNVMFEDSQLNLCMIDQWSHMASYTIDTNGLMGIRSKGCNDKEALPPPYIIGNTNVALLIIKSTFSENTSTEIQQALSLGYVVPQQVIPNKPSNYPTHALVPAYTQYNGGWVPDSGNACTGNSAEDKWCDSNGWYANPFFAYYDDIDGYESNILAYISTVDANGEAYDELTITPAGTVTTSVNGKDVNCQISYKDNLIQLLPGSNITIDAKLDCQFS